MMKKIRLAILNLGKVSGESKAASMKPYRNFATGY